MTLASHFLASWFYYLSCGDSNVSAVQDCGKDQIGSMYVNCLEERLTHNKHGLNVDSYYIQYMWAFITIDSNSPTSYPAS